MFFEKKVSKRSRKAMVDFLESHFRYDTMSSWNRSTSYAHCIKVHRIGLTSEQVDAAFKMMDVEYWDQIDSPISIFTQQTGGQYTIGTNGRSGGYLVMYNSHYEASEYKSFCRSCGQRNYAKVLDVKPGTAEAIIAQQVVGNNGCWHAETYLGQSAIQAIDLNDDEKLVLIRRFKKDAEWSTVSNRCGRCGKEGEHGRMNYDQTPRKLVTYPGQHIDMDEDFSEWSMDRLRNRVDLVLAFDRACDQIRLNFIDLLEESEVTEEVVMVPKTVKVLQPRA